MKIFSVIIDDGENVYKANGTAKNKKEFLDIYGGNGEVVKIEDVTGQYTISLEKVEKALQSGGFGDNEIKLIKACLETHKENFFE